MKLTMTCRNAFPDLNVFQEVAFPDLASDKGALLRFDICIPEFKMLIEYRGCTGFVKFVHRRRSNWERTRLHDGLKKLYAKYNGWNLVVFTHRAKIGNEKLVRRRIMRNA